MVLEIDSPLGPLPDGWILAHLVDLTTKIGSGATPLGGDAAYLAVRDKYALIRSQNIFDRKFDSKNLAYISSQDARRLDGVEVQPKDILLNITGDGITFSRACMVDPTVLPARVNQHVSIIRAKKEILDPGYLLSYLTHPQIKYYMESYNAGGSRRALTKAHIESFVIPLPPIEEQRAIARILGSMDDKIEANRRMNQTLEALARTLFKSWFVDFDPVQAKSEGREPAGMDAETAALFPDGFEESEGRMVPRGWKVGKLGEYLLNFDSNRVPVSGAERCKRKGLYPYHGAAGIMDYIDDYLFDGIYVLVGEDGSVIQEKGLAVTQYVWGRFWANNHAHVLQGKGAISSEQLYLYFQSETVAPYVTGAVQPKLSQGRMNGMPFLFAGDDVCTAFARIVLPFFAFLRSNVDCSNSLIAMRDALLPMLISGELRVKNADNSLPEHILSNTSDITDRNKEASYVTQKNIH